MCTACQSSINSERRFKAGHKMRRRLGIWAYRLGVLLICFCAAGCVSEKIAADLDPPPVPQFVTRTSDLSLVEHGIDAVAEGNYIYIAWNPSDAGDLSGYKVYRQAQDSISFLPPELIEDLPLSELSSASAPDYTDRSSLLSPNAQTGLSQGFYYWVSAYDASGNESGLSESAFYKLLPKATLSPPVQQNDSLVIQWSYATAAVSQVDYFVVRLFQSGGGAWEPFWLQQHAFFDPLRVVYPQSLAAGSYRVQVDVVGAAPANQPAGSEAALIFNIP